MISTSYIVCQEGMPLPQEQDPEEQTQAGLSQGGWVLTPRTMIHQVSRYEMRQGCYLRSQSVPVILSWEQFCPLKPLGSISRHFCCHNWERRCSGIWWVEATDVVNIPQSTGQSSQQRNPGRTTWQSWTVL